MSVIDRRMSREDARIMDNVIKLKARVQLHAYSLRQ